MGPPSSPFILKLFPISNLFYLITVSLRLLPQKIAPKPLTCLRSFINSLSDRFGHLHLSHISHETSWEQRRHNFIVEEKLTDCNSMCAEVTSLIQVHLQFWSFLISFSSFSSCLPFLSCCHQNNNILLMKFRLLTSAQHELHSDLRFFNLFHNLYVFLTAIEWLLNTHLLSHTLRIRKSNECLKLRNFLRPLFIF